MSWLKSIFDKIRNLPKRYSNPSDIQLMREVAAEATKWLGIHEKKGSSSPSVDVFRKATDGVADGEPWCAAFVQYCVTAVATRYGAEISMYPSELCTAIWERTPPEYRLKEPIPGCIMLWQVPGTIRGHAGIVLRRQENSSFVKTIEGNTRDPREGSFSTIRGVYPKIRCIHGSEDMKVLGFLNPFV